MSIADREKLIKVLEIGLDKIDRGSLPWAVEMLADHLIANGIYISKPCDAAPSKDWRLTNADRIRAMSDEELAEMFLSACVYREFCNGCPAEKEMPNCPGEILGKWEEWIKQPAEGE